MNLADVNLLVSAVNSDDVNHGTASTWLTTALNGRETLLLPWASLNGALRILTDRRILASPAPVVAMLDVVESWLARRNVRIPTPDAHHTKRMRQLLEAAGSGGPLVPDAHLAALAVQYDATVITFDSDFARFPGVRWQRPTLP